MFAIDFKPIIDLAFLGLSTAVTVAVPILVSALLRKYHIDAQSDLSRKLIAGATNAAAFGLHEGNKLADNDAPVEINDKAVAAAVGYFNSAFSPATIDKSKLTVPVADLVTAQMAKMILAPPPQVTMAPIPNPTEARTWPPF